MRHLLLSLYLLAALLISGRLAAFEGAAESEKEIRFEPGVRVVTNTTDPFATGGPNTLILYALPNGNSIEETMGRKRGEGVHWRFDIQHIAAQTRKLRAADPSRSYTVAYLEAEGKSWPSWRKKHDGADARIRQIVEELRQQTGAADVALMGHSGGGSFMFGFLNAHDELPAYLARVAFLDSNYGFDAELGHGTKLAKWLGASPSHALVVLAYDDRNVELNGKKIITSETGGTWRSTERMAAALAAEGVTLEAGSRGDYQRWSAPQVEFLAHRNPELKILHTALVGDRSGYIHALTVRTPLEDKVVRFDGPPEWDAFIAPGPDSNLDSNTSIHPIPARPADAPTGSAFIESIKDLPREGREEAVRAQLLAGNIPDFLRTTVPITVQALGLEGTTHTVTMQVMPDYLAIGSDADFVRMPMNPYTAQAFCDAFGFVLPTRKMVNDIWAGASIQIDPKPLTEARDATITFLQHDRLIVEQLAGRLPSGLVAGHKKDVVISDRIDEKPNRVAIYGWHYTTGKPIQPLTIVHVDWYVDYSHGIRPVRRMVRIDGKRDLPVAEVLRDPHLHNLLSDEGEIARARYGE
jgi:pimeloyl-ACP methyl ester carboxylesterase